MQFQSLLVTRDAEVARVLQPAMERLSISVEVCGAAQSGTAALNSERYDAVVIDCDDMLEGLEVLKGLRQTPSNRTAVAFALLNGSTNTQKAFQLGANFVLQKPISLLNASRCFNAALSTMVRERRRYFRHPVTIEVTVLFDQATPLKCASTNLSEGGMALVIEGTVPKNGPLQLAFVLPETSISIETKAQLAWLDGSGRAGVRFIEMARPMKEQLDRWLEARMETSPHH